MPLTLLPLPPFDLFVLCTFSFLFATSRLVFIAHLLLLIFSLFHVYDALLLPSSIIILYIPCRKRQPEKKEERKKKTPIRKPQTFFSHTPLVPQQHNQPPFILCTTKKNTPTPSSYIPLYLTLKLVHSALVYCSPRFAFGCFFPFFAHPSLACFLPSPVPFFLYCKNKTVTYPIIATT